MFLYKFVRESFFGRSLYHLSGRKVFTYPEESPDYVIPAKYLGKDEAGIESDVKEKAGASDTPVDSDSSSQSTKTNHILVDWEGEDDPENPYNWPLKYKIIFIAQIMILTAFVYMASAIYTPGIEEIMKDMGVGQVVATLPLTLFVFGYGIGPMVFSPLSENARFGRTSIYIITLFIFFILQIPTALVDNIAGLCILRFIAGFFASPCLATGGASVGDVINLPYIPVGISFWSIAAVCAPSSGPLFGAILSVKADYHWTFWFVCITSGASFVVLGWMLPESYSKTILYRKAERLRALTGNQDIVSEGHLENAKFSTHEMLVETLWRPFEVIIFEPVVLLINIYIGLVYSVMYLWFEAFPIVFVQVKGFTLIEMGVAYMCILVGILIAAAFYIPTIYHQFTKKMLSNQEVVPEVFIPMAIVGSIIMPIGIFIFGWTAAEDLHWIGPLIGAAVFAAGAFLVFQTLFNYLSMSFWRYLASVFAGNDLFRSMMAGAFPLFGKPLFLNLRTNRFAVGWGSSLLGFICVGMIAIPVLFYLNGPKLRARSKYAGAGA
ncbi:hypothetical_protein [Candidozyma auris]|uniref:hypothetical_protein n=1 Tax=Candidozyma auris TaxID=498019 RepID=UPI000D2BC8EB|nr:hypothetical_protein [[Candida] auris]QEO21650.1 hypothetical_protein [[Candida] auris]GBL47849.1 putative multidrug resistance protein [[Candida] auris]